MYTKGEPAIPAIQDDSRIRFVPPLFLQRYSAVRGIMEHKKWAGKIKKVVDFGCGECGFFYYVKKMNGVRELLEVDIEVDLLESRKSNVEPLLCDFLKRRKEPFKVSLLAGSIDDPDPRLIGTDMVVCIEVIEHLYPDTFEGVAYNIFGFIKPRVVVFTTPNAEYNVLFPLCKFRHDDHKFEWDRQQFTDWANNITTRFPNYTVSFEGVGGTPKDTLMDLGCCTQIAIFLAQSDDRTPFDDESRSFGICTYESKSEKMVGYVSPEFSDLCYYKVVTELEYPFEPELSTDQKILNESAFQINKYGVEYGDYYNYNLQRSEIPVDFLHLFVTKLCSLHEFIEILIKNYTIEDCEVLGQIQKCLIRTYDSVSSTNSTWGGTSDRGEYLVEDDSDPDWKTVQYSTSCKPSDITLEGNVSDPDQFEEWEDQCGSNQENIILGGNVSNPDQEWEDQPNPEVKGLECLGALSKKCQEHVPNPDPFATQDLSQSNSSLKRIPNPEEIECQDVRHSNISLEHGIECHTINLNISLECGSNSEVGESDTRHSNISLECVSNPEQQILECNNKDSKKSSNSGCMPKCRNNPQIDTNQFEDLKIDQTVPEILENQNSPVKILVNDPELTDLSGIGEVMTDEKDELRSHIFDTNPTQPLIEIIETLRQEVDEFPDSFELSNGFGISELSELSVVLTDSGFNNLLEGELIHDDVMETSGSIVLDKREIGWLMRLLPTEAEDLDYLSQGDNLNVNPNDDYNETSSDSTMDNEADDEADGPNSDQAMAVDSSFATLPMDSSSHSLAHISSIENEEMFYDSINHFVDDVGRPILSTPVLSGSTVEPNTPESITMTGCETVSLLGSVIESPGVIE